MANDIVEFLRQRDFQLVKELGHGASGKTVLLYDDVLDEHFVCKKYSPYDERVRAELFENFKREVKILHRLQHPNIVRVYTCFMYPKALAGYLLMEYVDGSDIEDYVVANPQRGVWLFRVAIQAFYYLESKNILHRDIRPQNFLVTEDGILKIIDFGFGKQVAASDDFGKSISLNWWCEPPNDFATNTYDFGTEVYFVGKLFQRILSKAGVEGFPYGSLLTQMCAMDPESRPRTFAECRATLIAKPEADPAFSETELEAYREFSDQLARTISTIESGAKYLTDPDEVLRLLETLYSRVMLETYLPANPPIIDCFMTGTYFYSRTRFPTEVLRSFLKFFRSWSRARRSIALNNLQTRLEAIERYNRQDDVPF